MQNALFSDAGTRLATFLLEEMEREGTGELRLRRRRSPERGDGAREVVTRSLKQLSESGVVRLSRGTVSVLEPSLLAQGKDEK